MSNSDKTLKSDFMTLILTLTEDKEGSDLG